MYMFTFLWVKRHLQHKNTYNIEAIVRDYRSRCIEKKKRKTSEHGKESGIRDVIR